MNGDEKKLYIEESNQSEYKSALFRDGGEKEFIVCEAEEQQSIIDERKEEKKEIDRSKEGQKMDENEIGFVLPGNQRVNSKTWGLVVYGEPHTYPTSDDARGTFHISTNYSGVLSKLAETLKRYHSFDFYQILGGHEHGTKDKKCHLQICVSLTESVNTIIKPGKFEFDGVTYLYMGFKAKNAHALTNYCKKDGEFYYLFPDKAIKNVYRVDKKGNKTFNAFATVYDNKEIIRMEEAVDIIATHDSKTLFQSYSNVSKALEHFIKPQLPPPKWTFPDLLVNFKNGVLYNWFINWCYPENLLRRKALLLYSSERNIGKTYFAKNLLNHEGYVVIFRGTFLKENVVGKIPKLVILDDMASYNDTNKETWKGLVCGQKTAIRDAYVNFLWNYEVPCIITTNNLSLVTNMMLDPQFKTQVVIVEIEEFMGPPEKRENRFNTVEIYVSPLVQQAADDKKKDRDNFAQLQKEKKKIFGVANVVNVEAKNETEEITNLKKELENSQKLASFLKNSNDAYRDELHKKENEAFDNNSLKNQIFNLQRKIEENSLDKLLKEIEELRREKENYKSQVEKLKSCLQAKRDRDEESEGPGDELGSEDSAIQSCDEDYIANPEDEAFIDDREELSVHSERKPLKKLKKGKKHIE